MNYKNSFESMGYIKIKNFLCSDEFEFLSNDLHKKIDDKIESTSFNKVGGYIIGNINVNAGIFAQKIFDILKLNNLNKIILDILEKPLDKFDVLFAGNLNFPGKGDQMFHTDGNFKDKMYLISVATQDIGLNSGPTEIVTDYHKRDIPYWKFSLKKKFKKKLTMKKGDIIIRKHNVWHRGTKNLSNYPRFLLTYLLFEKNKKIIQKYQTNHEIVFYNNFFKSNLTGRIKEFCYVHFKFVFFIYKFIKSLLNEFKK